MRGTARKTDLFWPIVVLAFLVVAGVAFAGLALVGEFDRAAARREQTVVANGVRGRMNEVAHLTDLRGRLGRRGAPSGQPFRHRVGAGQHWDVPVAEQQIRRFVHPVAGRPADFAAVNRGKPDSLSGYAPFVDSASSLVAAVRREEARRGVQPTHPRAGVLLTEPNTASSLAAVKGAIYILSATAVESDFGKATLNGPACSDRGDGDAARRALHRQLCRPFPAR